MGDKCMDRTRTVKEVEGMGMAESLQVIRRFVRLRGLGWELEVLMEGDVMGRSVREAMRFLRDEYGRGVRDRLVVRWLGQGMVALGMYGEVNRI